MTKKTLGLLVFVFLVLGGVFYATENRYQMVEITNHLSLFKDLAGKKIQKIQINRGTNSIDVALKDDVWTLPSRGNYPADPGKVRALLLKLLDLTVSQKVAESSEGFDALGVSETSVKNGKTKITFYDDTTEIGRLYLGDKRKLQRGAESADGTGGQYVRKGGQEIVYLIPEPIEAGATTAEWLDSEVANILQSHVERVEQFKVAAGGKEKRFEIIKAGGPNAEQRQEYSLKDGSQEPLNQALVTLVATGLENLRMGDVKPVDDEKLKDIRFDFETDYHLNNGLIYAVSSAERGEMVYLKIAVEFENLSQAAPKEGEKPAPVSSAEEAAKISSRHQGWVYEVPKYVASKFRQERSDLEVKKNDESNV